MHDYPQHGLSCCIFEYLILNMTKDIAWLFCVNSPAFTLLDVTIKIKMMMLMMMMKMMMMMMMMMIMTMMIMIGLLLFSVCLCVLFTC